MKKVVIVGGGSSGWMAAAYLNGALNRQRSARKIEIVVIEAPDLPRISVGEATIPSIRHLLAVIGVDEFDFMQVADATFKQSIKYVNWLKNDKNHYHHPFSRLRTQPLDYSGINWLTSDRSIPFMETVSAQPIICEMGRAPLMLSSWDMGAPLTYAYHMDAQKFADYLKAFSIQRGVNYKKALVTEVNLLDNGHIETVQTDTGEKIAGDLFIDCTGFRSKLMGGKLDVGMDDFSQFLLCDRAVTMHVPYETHYPGKVRPYTTATALSAGWVWDIPLRSKRSIGYVYSSSFISDQDADQEMRSYQGGETANLASRIVPFSVGKRKKHWQGNCVALGLSGGFIEPLESTGLYLSDLGVVALAEHFPFQSEAMEQLAFRYNRILSNRYYEILDFINMHYCMTQRSDSPFWLEVQKPEHITERLKAKLAFWKLKPPSSFDFEDQSFSTLRESPDSRLDINIDPRPAVDTAGLWNHESYECILYGMDFLKTEYARKNGMKLPQTRISSHLLNRLQEAKSKLPPHEIWLKEKMNMDSYVARDQPSGWN